MNKSFIYNYQKLVTYPLDDDKFQSEEQSGWVYLMYNHVSKLYKIGITKDPKGRCRGLCNASGCEITLVQAILMEIGYDESAKTVESALHILLKNKRKYGEWFDLSIYDLARLQQMLWFLEGAAYYFNQPNRLSDYYKSIFYERDTVASLH